MHASGLSRDELFITTKLWNDDQGYDRGRRALEDEPRAARARHVDLYLIHWPAPAQDRYVETWKALDRGPGGRATRAIGVSNFQPEHLRRIVDETGVTPAVNQIELHPYLTQPGLRREHAERGIVTEAWSPLAKGKATRGPGGHGDRLRARPGRPGQIVLRWHVQLGNVVFPKSMTPERLEREHRHLRLRAHAARRWSRIEALDRGERTGPGSRHVQRLSTASRPSSASASASAEPGGAL